MGTFPQLKTSAVAQYPATRSLRFQNQTVRFLDGSAQRYRDSSGLLHTWEIRLELLDDTELVAIEELFSDAAGSSGSFTFTDPWDGKVYPNCSFASDDLEIISVAEMRGNTSLTIIENRE